MGKRLASLKNFVALCGQRLGDTLGARELFLAVGIPLLGYGCSLAYWPAAFIVPGAILVAIAAFGVS